MSRKTISALPAALATATAIAVILTIVDASKIAYTCAVNGIDVCNDNGKVKVFQDADAAIRLIAGMTQGVADFTVSVTNPGLLQPTLKLGDPIAEKAKKLAKATAQVLNLTDYKTMADASVAQAVASGWNTGNALERSEHARLVLVQSTIADALAEAQQRKTANT
jgi:hypothetical protein